MQETNEETHVCPEGGAESGAQEADSTPIDVGLALVVQQWESLPEAVRAGILAMVKASG